MRAVVEDVRATGPCSLGCNRCRLETPAVSSPVAADAGVHGDEPAVSVRSGRELNATAKWMLVIPNIAVTFRMMVRAFSEELWSAAVPVLERVNRRAPMQDGLR